MKEKISCDIVSHAVTLLSIYVYMKAFIKKNLWSASTYPVPAVTLNLDTLDFFLDIPLQLCVMKILQP